jgi:hypothetical protein
MSRLPGRWRRDKRVAWRVLDGKVVVVGGHAGRLYVLNRTATCVWEAVGEGGSSADDVAARLTARFAVDPARARADAIGFLEELAGRGLLQPENP